MESYSERNKNNARELRPI